MHVSAVHDHMSTLPCCAHCCAPCCQARPSLHELAVCDCTDSLGRQGRGGRCCCHCAALLICASRPVPSSCHVCHGKSCGCHVISPKVKPCFNILMSPSIGGPEEKSRRCELRDRLLQHRTTSAAVAFSPHCRGLQDSVSRKEDQLSRMGSSKKSSGKASKQCGCRSKAGESEKQPGLSEHA